MDKVIKRDRFFGRDKEIKESRKKVNIYRRSTSKTENESTIKFEIEDPLDNVGSDCKYISVRRPRRKTKSNVDAVEIVKNKLWPCKKCNQVLLTKRLLTAHRKAEHSTVDVEEHTFKFDKAQELYICNTCSAEYQDEIDIEKHMKTHEESFQCTVCDKKFKRVYDLGTHSIIHSKDQLFRCPLCAYKTAKRTALLVHINYVHLKKFVYICDKCGKGFNDAVIFKEHDNEHLGIKPFSCIVCAKTFTYSRYLVTHQVRFHRVPIDGQLLPNQCPVCKKVFSKALTLEKHCEEKHLNNSKPQERKHLCDTCGKGFSQKNKLQLHYRVHTGFKPHTCTYCGKGFTKKDYLVMHERVHSGEKPYSCCFCDKRFSQGAPLRTHIRSHTGEKPYVCEFCSTGFASKSALISHCKNCAGHKDK